MATDNSPELLAAAAYSDHGARHVPLLTAFERALKILDEMFRRIEREMYAGLAYTASLPSAGRQPSRDGYDKKLADSAVALSRALSQAGAVHARLLEQEAAAADSMSDEEKTRYMVAALRAKPESVRRAVAEALLAP